MGKRIDNTKCHYLKIHRSAGNVVAYYDRMLAPSGVTARQYSLLYEIGEHEGCTVSELSQLTELDRTTLARSLKSLFKGGLIEDKKNSGARNSILVLTEQGRATRDQGQKLWEKAQERMETVIGRDKLQELENIMEQFMLL